MTRVPLHIETFVEDSFSENAYVPSTLADSGERVGWIVDPSYPPQIDELLEYVRREHIRVERIVLTHGHLDHIAGLDRAKDSHPDARVSMALAEHDMLGRPELNLSIMTGSPMALSTRAEADLVPGEDLRLGNLLWRVLDVSGHSPAGRALYCARAGVVFTGDALFAGGIGRYDFPGSDGRQLLRNIRENLLSLPAETRVYSGHGPTTTIGNERKSNPFLTE